MLIPLDSIAVLNRQRKDIDHAKVNDLANSIKESGLLHSIVVRRPHPDEDVGGRPYVLVVGGRRIAAHILLDRNEIEARLLEDLDPVSAEIAELDENLKRVDISWQEEVEARERIHHLRQLSIETGATIKDARGAIVTAVQSLRETAEEFDLSKAAFSRDLKLAQLIRDDPTLRNATSKASALRQAAFRASLAEKAANVEASATANIGSRLYIQDAAIFAMTLAPQSVDLVFTDLPYGIDQFEVQSTGDIHEGASKFDDSEERLRNLLDHLIPEIPRILKPEGWVCFFMCYEWHADLMARLQTAGLKVQFPPWIWHRPGSSNWGHFPEFNAANRYEMIVVASRDGARLCKKPVENVLTYEAVATAEKTHNHQKPHELCKEVIERCTVPGQMVVDFCFGSGAHLAAAAEMGREFKGSETNPLMRDVALGNIAPFFKPRTL